MRLSYALLLLLAVSPLQADDHAELLNQEERQWLDSLQGPLVLGTEFGYHPYNFIDEDGELGGVVADYVQLMEENLGVEFETRSYTTFTEVLAAARNREIDIVPLIVAAPERSSYLNFTQPAYETRDRIFTRQENQLSLSLDNMGDLRVGLVKGYALQAEIEADYPHINLVLVPTEVRGLLDLSTGEIDAFISEVGTSSYYIQQEAITNLRVAGELDRVDPQTFGTRSDWPILNRIIGKGLASITPEQHAEIQHRWINLGGVDPRELDLLWNQVRTVVALILAVLVAVLIWSFALRRLVAKRTFELQQELAERRLVEADKARLAIAVEQSTEFVLVVDTSAIIEYANLAFLEAFGAVNLEGRPFNSLATGAAKRTLSEALRIAEDAGNWSGQVVLAPDQDRALKVRMNIAPIFDEVKKIVGYVANGRDVTKEEQLESRLRQGERLSALGTLAGGIAHDFNNLLVPIIGYTDLIREDSPEELAPFLDGIAEASERARDLVQRIMIFGRGGSGDLVPLDLRFEIEDSIAFLRSLVPTTIRLQADLKECGAILGERTQIQQVLLNLSSNASDAMAENGGTLSITLERRTIDENSDSGIPDIPPGDYASLTVSDTGVGMTEDIKARIFDPYFSAKQQASGTGLGLAIVHSVVARHGGFINVESTPDVGTTFRIFLPLVAEQPSTLDDAAKAGMSSGSGETILLVDDDELVLATVQQMLHGLGYKVYAWSDPIDAVEAFGAKPDAFDAILADFTMPGLTGVQLAEQVLAIRPDIPIAIMTGNTTALQGYDKMYISKPMQLKKLSDCLRELLASS